MTERFSEPAPRLKFFKERAERIDKSEYHEITAEILSDFRDHFHIVEPAEQLKDKDSFGDLDFVCLPKRGIDESYFRNILGPRLLGYNRTGVVHSILIKLKSGKSVQVDMIQGRDAADFESKRMYYAKGHLSSVVGMMAKKLHFKYGIDGFFKRFKDKRGNWHDILISQDLRDGLTALGFDANAYPNIHTLDDIVSYIKTSPLFDASYYQFDNLVRRDKEAVGRNVREEHVVKQLGLSSQVRKVEDENSFFKKFFPEAFKNFQDEGAKINREVYAAGEINGETVMKTLGVAPGPIVGKILKFLGDQYPRAKELTEEMIVKIKTEILK